MPPSRPRPGTLEWHAEQHPDAPAILLGDKVITRAELERQAGALAERLARDHAVEPGHLLSAAGGIGRWSLTLSWAAAKLGAGLVGLPPGPGAGVDGAIHVSPVSIEATPQPAQRRLSGSHPPPDAVTFSRRGRAVRRRFTPERVAALAPTIGDLIARLRAAPGTTLALCGPVSDPVLTFVAGVVLVGGGTVAVAETASEALALAAEHGAELVALTPDGVDGLAALTGPQREALDLTAAEVLVTGGAPLTLRGQEVAEDLFGAEGLVDVYLTADTGIAAVRSAGAGHHVLLDGVEARAGAAGGLELRSPLAAGAGWTATGDRTTLLADGTLRP